MRPSAKMPRWLKRHWQLTAATTYLATSQLVFLLVLAGWPLSWKGSSGTQYIAKVEIVTDELLKRVYPMPIAENNWPTRLCQSPELDLDDVALWENTTNRNLGRKGSSVVCDLPHRLAASAPPNRPCVTPKSASVIGRK